MTDADVLWDKLSTPYGAHQFPLRYCHNFTTDDNHKIGITIYSDDKHPREVDILVDGENITTGYHVSYNTIGDYTHIILRSPIDYQIILRL